MSPLKQICAQYSTCLFIEICMSHQWISSTILSLYYFCSGSYDLSSLGYYGLFIPGYQVWPFHLLHKHQGKAFSLCFIFLKNKTNTWKVQLEVSENIHKALPYISACVYAQSRGGPFLVGLQPDDTACMSIWGLVASQCQALPLNSSSLRNKSREKVTQGSNYQGKKLKLFQILE